MTLSNAKLRHFTVSGLIIAAVLWLMKWFNKDPKNLPTTLAPTICDLVSIWLLLSTATLVFSISKCFVNCPTFDSFQLSFDSTDSYVTGMEYWFMYVAPIVFLLELAGSAVILIQKPNASCSTVAPCSWVPLLATLAIYW